MKVSSPVGVFPYTIERVRPAPGSLIIEGRMGAWPSHVEVSAGDVGTVARIAARPFAVIAILAAVLLLLRKRSRQYRS